MSFSPFALHARVLAGVEAVGYREPTPIQVQAIPEVMSGRDVLGLAQTGTGKTAAFALPILDRLLRQPRRGVTRALIVAPTRELAEQIHQSFRDLGQATQVRSATIYGGVGMNPQIQALKRGTEIIVATPGRLLDLLGQGYGDLSKLEVLVLDEADHMFDMGFLPDIRRILQQLPRERQSLLFSATMPEAVKHLVNETLRNHVTVAVDRSAPAQTVAHALYPVATHLKTDLLQALLREWDARRVLVFTRTKHRAKRLAEKLDGGGLFVTSIQGNLSQRKRQEALDAFRSGKIHVLVATDIAARGIDVAQVTHVVNFDIPDTEEAYVHRIGRTGRARHEGDAITFITSEDAEMVRRIEKALGERIPRQQLDSFDYQLPAPRAVDAETRRFERGGVAGGGQANRARPSARPSPRGASAPRPAGGRPDGGRPAPGPGGRRPDPRSDAGRPAGTRSGAGRPSDPQLVAPTPHHRDDGEAPRRRRRNRRPGGASSSS
jgi:ATP-dependent RNA helicase RhlE